GRHDAPGAQPGRRSASSGSDREHNSASWLAATGTSRGSSLSSFSRSRLRRSRPRSWRTGLEYGLRAHLFQHAMERELAHLVRGRIWVSVTLIVLIQLNYVLAPRFPLLERF